MKLKSLQFFNIIVLTKINYWGLGIKFQFLYEMHFTPIYPQQLVNEQVRFWTKSQAWEKILNDLQLCMINYSNIWTTKTHNFTPIIRHLINLQIHQIKSTNIYLF